MKKNRLLSLLLCFCLAFTLLPLQAMAVSAITKITITMSDLKVGKPLPTDAKTAAKASTEVVKVEWTGQSADGVMMYDVLNPVVITVKIKEGKDARFSPDKATSATINNRKATVERLDDQTVLVRYTFEAAKSEALKAAEKNNTVIPLDVMVTAPNEAETPDTTGKILGNGVVYYAVTGISWSGEMDANGQFKAGVPYTVTVSARILDTRPEVNFYNLNNQINNKSANVVSVNGKDITCSYTFPAFEPKAVVAEKEAAEKAEKDAKNQAYRDKKAQEAHDAEVERRWSQAEADAKYPLASPITLLVSEETMDMGALNDPSSFGTYEKGVNIILLWSGRANYPTLDGSVIAEAPDEPWVNSKYHSTINYYRPTRVVYDLYRKDDPSIGCFPNTTELWLSPKCDIQGILDHIGRGYGDDRISFNTWRHTVFIPDSLYPNGPKYNVNTIPNCRVMLYSGNDVYAAVEKGSAAARDWCTSHSYTAQIIAHDRIYSYPTCQSDMRYYYSCAKCGKCEGNPSHTFFPKTNSTDFTEDNGLYTACTYSEKVLTDEHFLGLNANGDRVYFYACKYCGKDERQKDLATTYEHYTKVMGGEGGQAGWQRYVENQKKLWSPGNTYYESALKATPEKDSTRDTYAVAADKFVWAKVSDWARTDVQEASNAGLIDVNLLGVDYSATVNREQFASIAVKLAEKMTGKSITPAPSGTFADTDSEYARKAYAAGITTGVSANAFDPNGSLNRQQMATFLYRALQYVKQNSDTEYTVYTPKLGNYTDGAQVADWATQSMGFMNALGLIKGVTDTTLAPTAGCTVEQALIVAYRSLDAGGIGWYQCVKSPAGNMDHYSTSDKCSYTYGDRVWMTSSQGHCVDPWGRPAGVDIREFYAIKDR